MAHPIRNRMPKLLQLALDNSGAERSFRAETKGDEATIYVYDIIGGYWGGVNAEQFARDLAALDSGVKTIHLRINSPGGDVFEARAMMVALQQQRADVIAHIDGIAASAATSLMMAAKRIEIARGGRLMIHKAWTIMMGNEDDLRAEADVLKGIDADIVADYKGRTGKTEQQLQDWMAAETWFSADQAKEAGFVDDVIETTAKADNRWNLAAYSNVPQDLLEPPKPRAAHDRGALERRLKLLEACSA